MAGAERQDGTFEALVLAGQRPGGDPLLQGRAERHKGLIEIAGQVMLERVVLALAEATHIDRITISASEADLLDSLPRLSALKESGRLRVIASAATPATSAAAALERIDTPLLITTSDHALLTATIIDRFCAEALDQASTVTVGLTSAAAVERAAPGSKRTYLSFRDGQFTGTNLFALTGPDALKAVTFWRRVEADRKRPWHIARRFGPLLLLGYLLRLWTLEDALKRAAGPLGATVAAVVLENGEAGIDVDKPADIVLVEKILKRRA